jgi:hypothetical protein
MRTRRVTDDGMVSVPLSWSEQYEELKAERDRLREAVEADRPAQIANLKALIAERDRLRWITYRCWAAWNDLAISDPDGSLDLNRADSNLLDETIKWSIEHRTELDG